MASVIAKNGVLFNIADQAPSPSKDYCQVVVTTNKVENTRVVNRFHS